MAVGAPVARREWHPEASVVLDANHVSLRAWRLGLSQRAVAVAVSEGCAVNRVSKVKLGKLVEQCEAALRDKSQQSFIVWRGDMWAILAAAHELRKRGLLETHGSSSATNAVAGLVEGSRTRKREKASYD